jgi:hypothetical protein
MSSKKYHWLFLPGAALLGCYAWMLLFPQNEIPAAVPLPFLAVRKV